jgi:hypothetical protein
MNIWCDLIIDFSKGLVLPGAKKKVDRVFIKQKIMLSRPKNFNKLMKYERKTMFIWFKKNTCLLICKSSWSIPDVSINLNLIYTDCLGWWWSSLPNLTIHASK